MHAFGLIARSPAIRASRRLRTSQHSKQAMAVNHAGPGRKARFLTADELQEHPEYPYITWDLQPASKGRVAVADGRGGPFQISYEVHGSGNTRLVFIMGLGSIKSAWQRQYKDFGHTRGDRYSCLVFDNRGVGESDKPMLRYTTSEMAKDTLEIIDHVGWTSKRQLHVIGISMGGMIAQELALMIPSRIASLSLVSTTAALKNTVGFLENLKARIALFVPKAVDTQLNNVAYNLFTDDWLPKPDELEYTKEPFPTNRDRVMASELKKRLDPNSMTFLSFTSQAIAAGWHHKSPEELKFLADQIGRERIMVAHGGKDRMISFSNGEALLDGLGGEKSGVSVKFEMDMGHVFPIEMRKEFNVGVEELVQKAERLNESGA